MQKICELDIVQTRLSKKLEAHVPKVQSSQKKQYKYRVAIGWNHTRLQNDDVAGFVTNRMFLTQENRKVNKDN